MLLSIINLHHNSNQDFKDELVKESVTALPAVPVCLHNHSQQTSTDSKSSHQMN